MRKSARIRVRIDDKTFTLYLSSHGTPAFIRDVIRRGVRGNRRDISHDPERLMWRCYDVLRNHTITVSAFPIKDIVWKYEFDLTTDIIPIVKYHGFGSDRESPLFEWLGSDRSIAKAKTVAHLAERRGKQPIGRPSGTRQVVMKHGERQPDYIDEATGKAVYKD